MPGGGGARRGAKNSDYSTSQRSRATFRDDTSSITQSRIHEETEESKLSAFNEEELDETEHSKDVESHDITTDSDEDEEDEDILIKPKDLIVSYKSDQKPMNLLMLLFSSNHQLMRESGCGVVVKSI